MAEEVYTYRGGERVLLRKRPDQFVVRRLPTDLPASTFGRSEQVSSASARVTCRAEDRDRLMADARALAPTHHAYEDAATGQEFLITDRILVTFAQPLSAEAVASFAGRYGLQLLTDLGDNTYLLRLTSATGENPVKLIVRLTEQERGVVATAEHDLNVRVRRRNLPAITDPQYQREWHLHRRAAAAADYDHRSSALVDEAWQALGGFGDRSVVIGITDDGCQLDHPDFDSTGKFASWAYLDGTKLVRKGLPGSSPARMYQQHADHGTACAGVVAAENDGTMTVGAAPHCRLLPIKWESDESQLYISDAKLLIALGFLATRVDIISNSWGSTPTTTWSLQVLQRIKALAATGGRRGKGILFLWAAGNENCPLQHTGTRDVPYTNGWEWDGTSAVWVGVATTREFRNNLVGIPGVLHIAALASTAQRSHYSNYGTGIDVCAPSSNSHAYWRMSLPGRSIITAGPEGGVDPEFGGTSSATPLVAGVAALVISANPDLTALEVAAILKETASTNLDLTPWPKTPPAAYDPNPSWDVSPIPPFDQGTFAPAGQHQWSPWFGAGRVDAEHAVREAMRRRPHVPLFPVPSRPQPSTEVL